MRGRENGHRFKLGILLLSGVALLIFTAFIGTGCVRQPAVQHEASFAALETIREINSHTVAVVVYYYMDDAEFERRTGIKQSNDELHPLQQVMILDNSTVLLPDGRPAKLMAYIGAGTLLRDNYVLSVNHLFEDDMNTVASRIWVFQKDTDHGIKADIVVRTGAEVFAVDYAVIKLQEDLGMPGLEIALPEETDVGQKVIFTGSVQGAAFFSRFSFITEFQRFFNKNSAGQLELTMWETFPFYCIYPSGGGDSGGNICNIDGKVVTVMYCGISIYGTSVVFGNPPQMLWDFLEENELTWLASRTN